MKRILFFAIVFFLTTFSYGQQGPNWHYSYYFDTYNNFGAICPIDENLIYVMLDEGKFNKSLDGGTTWTSYNLGIQEEFYDMAFVDSNNGLAIGGSGTILKTTDGGLNWTSISSGTTNDLLSIEIISQNNIWVVGKNGTVLRSTDYGNTWASYNSLSTERLNSVRFRNANKGYIAGNNGSLFHTSDGGTTWTTINLGTTDDLFSLSLTENNTQLLAGSVNYAYRGYHAYKTIDGINWTSYALMPMGGGWGVSKLYFKNDTLGFYISANASMCNCSKVEIDNAINSAQNWELGYCGRGGDISVGYSDMAFVNENVGFALNGELFFKTTNGGLGWDPNWSCEGLPGEIYAVKEFDKDILTIYPNPSQGNQIHIDFSNGDLDSFSIEIVDIHGKQVFTLTKVKNDPIDITHLQTGIYFVNILKEGKMLGSEKFIKSN